MVTLRDPFSDGDLIWWESNGSRPIQAYLKQENGSYLTVGGHREWTFDQLLAHYEDQPVSGPYRVVQSENWTGYDFTMPDSER